METISFRRATENDLELYYNWLNDAMVRAQSFNSSEVSLADHRNWFLAKVKDPSCSMMVFENSNGRSIGQVRIQKIDPSNAVIGFSIDAEFRGRGFGTEMIRLSTAEFFEFNKTMILHAYVKLENIASKKTFERAGFRLEQEIIQNNYKSFHYIKYAYREF